jgi:mannose-6-phosphate isomerase-like protein (cupin superfamily)
MGIKNYLRRIMMRKIAFLVAISMGILAAMGLNARVAGKPQTTSKVLPATDVTSEDIQNVLKKEIADGKPVDDRSIRVVDVGGNNVGIGIVYRLAPGTQGLSASHDKVSEVYYMIEGSGTLVTGGTIVNPKRRDSGNVVVAQVNGPGVSGDTIKDGISRRIKAGDMVIIPAGTPHWWSQVESPTMTYVVVRVDPSQVVALK